MANGALPGFRDFYPTEFAERAFIERTWREVARRHAFLEYDGPPLEPLELYTRKSGEEIVAQLYVFTDKGGREISLRPEMTPTLARMVASRANALRKPVRWFAIPQLFRYERQQKGRLREHFQLNVDIIGEPDVTADAELLATAVEVVRAFGLTATDVRARVSDRRLVTLLLEHIGVKETQMSAVFAVVDKIDRRPRHESDRRLVAAGLTRDTIADLFDSLQISSLEALRARFASGSNDAGAPFRDRLTELTRYFDYLARLGVRDWVTLDLSIVRGLAYYTGIVFELFDARGEFRAICGGGRYDNLLEALGGADLPALGFGMGDVVLGELLRARGLLRAGASAPEYWVAGEEASLTPDVMTVARALRQSGASVEYALRPQQLGRQLKAAGAAGIDRVVIVGPDFSASGEVTLKSLNSGDERRFRVDIGSGDLSPVGT